MKISALTFLDVSKTDHFSLRKWASMHKQEGKWNDPKQMKWIFMVCFFLGVCVRRKGSLSVSQRHPFNCSTSDTTLKSWIIQRALIAAPRYPSLPWYSTTLGASCCFSAASPRDTGSTQTQRSSWTYSQEHTTLGEEGFTGRCAQVRTCAQELRGMGEAQRIMNPPALTKSKQIDWTGSLICIGLIEDVICCWINVVVSKSNL